MKRVVVTGLGIISPLGNTVADFWDNLLKGQSGARTITRFNPEAFRTRIACEVPEFDPTKYLERNEVKRSDLFTQYALAASGQAIEDSGFNMDRISPFDVGVIWGSGQGGMTTFEEQLKDYVQNDFRPRFNPFFVPKFITNMAPGMISMRRGYSGISYSTVSACSSANTALMDAFNYIRWGKATIIISGGSEAPITEASVGGFCAMKAMSTRNEDPQKASRPFDVNRDGFLMGEGAGALVLEEYEHARKRGAPIYAELSGAAMTSDAYHITSPHPDGIGASEAMKRALQEAGISITQLDYLNAHATSTGIGDISEARAISHLLGNGKNKLRISATKSMTGHLFGAAGAIEAIISIKAIRNKVIPPTINTEEIDPEVPRNLKLVLKEPLEQEVNTVMSNNFGFGGHNGIVVFKKV